MEKEQYFIEGNSIGIRFESNGDEFNYISNIKEKNDNGVWLAAPRDGSMYVPMRTGMNIKIMLPNLSSPLGAHVHVVALRSVDSIKQFKINYPAYWEGLLHDVSTRIKVNLPAALEKMDDLKQGVRKQIPAVVLDIASFGARVLARTPLKLGLMLGMKFHIPDYSKTVAGIAEVAKLTSGQSGGKITYRGVTGAFDVSVRFHSLRANDLKLIEKYIAEGALSLAAYRFENEPDRSSIL